MLKELWARFEAAVQKDDAELRSATRELIAEIKARIEHIEEQLGIVHAAPAPVVAEVAPVVPETPVAPVAEPVAAPVQEAPVSPTEAVSVPDAPAPHEEVKTEETPTDAPKQD